MDEFVACMDVTRSAVAARIREFAKGGGYVDLDSFEPRDARDVAVLFEARAAHPEGLPGLEFRRMNDMSNGKYVSGPKLFFRLKEDER